MSKIELPTKCQYKSTECSGTELAKYEAKLKSVITWDGKVCQQCLIAMQRVIYRNNMGTLEFRELNSDVWRQYGSDNDPSHAGRTDHMA